MRRTHASTRPGGGFTLVELLVVVVIIGIISAAALPVVLPALNQRRVSEGARLVQAVLAGSRDAAVRANAPRGVRLLPDPLFNFSASAVGGQPLAANRFVPIEPAPDYSEGAVNGYVVPDSSGLIPLPTSSAPYQVPYTIVGFYEKSVTIGTTSFIVRYLRVQSNEVNVDKYDTYPDPTDPTIVKHNVVAVPQVPTGWQFNIRQGDKIRFNDAGAYYTIAGPIHGAPVTSNPERYIWYKAAGTELTTYGDANSRVNSGQPLEYINLLNGIDDDGDGWVDESCDGIDNDGDGIIDPGYNGVDDNGDGVIDDPAELLIGLDGTGAPSKSAGSEYEEEKYLGIQTSSPPSNTSYTILRRPVVSPNAVETTLPEGVVIDLTTWNAAAATPSDAPVRFLPERSRLPVDPFAGYVDILIDQTGRIVPPGAGSGNGAYNANSPLATLPFYHFWVTEREGVVPPLYGTQATTAATGAYLIPVANPKYKASPPLTYLLPMPQGLGTVDANGAPIVLKGERRLITLFTKTGQIVANSIETFQLNDISAPYYDAQNGTKESL